MMKFTMQNLSQERHAEPKVGNVYQSRGGRRGETPDYWIIVGMSGSGGSTSISMIGVKATGAVVSATKYYRHAVEKWPLAGFCPDVVNATYNVEMF